MTIRQFLFRAFIALILFNVGAFGVNIYLIVLNYRALYSNPDYVLPTWLQAVVLPLMETEKYPQVTMAEAIAAFDRSGHRQSRVLGRVIDVKRAPDGDTHITLADGMFRLVAEIDNRYHPLPVPPVGIYIAAAGMVSYDQKNPCRVRESSHRWHEIHPLLDWVEVRAPEAKSIKTRYFRRRHGLTLK
jgi:hypothetical protein